MASFIPTVSMLNTSSAGSPQFWGRDFLEGECLCSRQKQGDGLSNTPRKEVSYHPETQVMVTGLSTGQEV